ncbi:MAG: VapC toxin family PIN domain ribonuclease, partial [Natronomonas sp.]|nr:VapC toxin family PIN domain ribonuclease [Natronomonas sp.]
RTVDTVLDSYPIAGMTPRISRRAGRLLGQRMAAANDGEGPRIAKGDAVIAATALERGEPVLAEDKYFRNISGITHETYR